MSGRGGVVRGGVAIVGPVSGERRGGEGADGRRASLDVSGKTGVPLDFGMFL